MRHTHPPPHTAQRGGFFRLLGSLISRSYMKPSDELVAAMVACFPEALWELYQERAAIRQHSGGQSRELAEALAVLDVIRIHTREAMVCWL